MLRDIIVTHVPMKKMNFQDRVLFLGQMIRYLVLLADGQIPVRFNCILISLLYASIIHYTFSRPSLTIVTFMVINESIWLAP